MDAKGLSGPAQTTLVKWIGVIIVVGMVLWFIRDMWDKLNQNPSLSVVLIIGILVLVLGGSLVFGKIKIKRK